MAQRPLSPFLHYRWQYSNAFSLCHRLSGLALFVALAFFAVGLHALSDSERSFATFVTVAGHGAGRVLALVLALSLVFHIGNGIRHLGWDMGLGHERAQARRSARWVLWSVVSAAAVAIGAWLALTLDAIR